MVEEFQEERIERKGHIFGDSLDSEKRRALKDVIIFKSYLKSRTFTN